MKRQSLKHHICCKIGVVGYPKNDKFWSGRLRCCRWCSSMFIEYQKAFYSQRNSDCEVGGPVEKSNLLGIIFAAKLGLWVIQK